MSDSSISGKIAKEFHSVLYVAHSIFAHFSFDGIIALVVILLENLVQCFPVCHPCTEGHFGGFSINVSGHSVNDETFPDFVLEQFSRSQAPTSKICFEVTETAAIANLENARDFMSRMKIIGCRFSLDDFGTGLSSYSYLRNLPVDYVKIDGVFVKDIVDNPGDYAVVRSINEIGHYMGKQTIAEYVENEDVMKCVREIGVDYMQGYHIAKPIRLDELRF